MSEDNRIIDAAKAAWQSQQLAVPPLSAEYLRNRVEERARETRTRNSLEYLCTAAALGLCAWLGAVGDGMLLRVGVVLTAAGLLFSFYKWRQLRTEWSMDGVDGAAGLEFYKRELARLRDVHLGLWKYVPAVLPGAAVLLAWGLLERTAPGNVQRVIGLVIAVVVWIGVMVRHELQEARRYARELASMEGEPRA